MDEDAYYAYSKPTEKRQKRKRRPLPDIPESERKRNIGVMTQTDLYEDWDIFYENCTSGNSGSMCKSSTKPTISSNIINIFVDYIFIKLFTQTMSFK